MNWNSSSSRILVALAVLIVAVYTSSLSSIAQSSQGRISGDFTVILYSTDTPDYDEYYIVYPLATIEPKSLIYSVNSICRLYSVTISSLGSYTIGLAVNNTIQRISVDGGIIRIELRNIDTDEKIVDMILVPELKAVKISVVPVYLWVEDPLTKILTRKQRLSLYISAYGAETTIKSYNISNIADTISFSVGDFSYTSITAINHYIQIYYEAAEPHNIMIVFTHATTTETITETEVITTTETVVTTVKETKTLAVTEYTTYTVTSTRYIRDTTTVTTTIYETTTAYLTSTYTKTITTSVTIPITITQSETLLTSLAPIIIAVLMVVVVVAVTVYMFRKR